MKTSKAAGEKSVREKIIAAYIVQLENQGEPPSSVAQLCQKLKITQKSFYNEFPTLGAVEKAFWKEWIDTIIQGVTRGREWESFAAKEQYLAFLFAFSGAAPDRRSLLEQCFGKSSLLCAPSSLEGLKNSFKEFAGVIIDRGMERGEIAPRGAISSFYPELFYTHWRCTLDFFLKDESQGFERTDAFIEKSVELAFDLLSTQAIDSAADLARFLLPQFANFGSRS